ncbi:flavin-binding monooxygenase-like family protein [Flagelloscypha sp. PMI_526]|nr:flavin-binding monooxygenase-like family protein [Flagelloscypha sp. PMI_526]
MADPIVASTGISLPSAEEAVPDIHAKYSAERDKRLRSDGLDQFADLSKTPEYAYLAQDPWADHSALNAKPSAINDGETYKCFVLGAGYGGLLYAAKLVKAGIKPEDIRLADIGGGFGGTWYWNRYPGLMCDTESYMYMPLLEDIGTMPAHKYSYGPELRAHAEAIAEKFKLTDKASFRTEIKSATWSDDEKLWTLTAKKSRGPNEPTSDLTFKSQFMFAATGVLNFPQVPKIPGLSEYEGQHFHTSRWNYAYTGGSPGASPTLDKLKDKRVAILGTGATAVQIVPVVAKWAKELVVFQRTPSSVDIRGQRETTLDDWKDIANKPGWQVARSKNFNSFVSNAPEDQNLVNDGWTWGPAYSALAGGPLRGIVPMEKIPEDIASFYALDLTRSNRIRGRVAEIVKDKATAESLKAWYPVWCKRPTFHDDYLHAFNLPNVQLVDTDGKGIDRLSASGVVFNGKEYPVDLLILSTGYRSPAAGSGSPAFRANITITGRGGKDMDDKWVNAIGSLHGAISRDFPNLFFPGPLHVGPSANQVFVLDQMSTHAAYIVSEAEKKATSERYSIEPTFEDEEAYVGMIMSGAGNLAAVAGCTPSYINSEGAVGKPRPMEEQIKKARGSIYPAGANKFAEMLEEWRNKGDLQGLEIKSG